MTTRTGHVVAADGTRLAYQWHGTGRPLMLLAGQANDHTWWNRARGDFPSTITMDYRGTGASDAPDVPYSTTGFADDVIAVLDGLGVAEADVYGTSMGGRVAQWVAARYPGRVRRLVLGCTSPGGTHGIERTNDVRLALAKRHSVEAREALEDMMYTPTWRAANPGPYTVLGAHGMPPHAVRGHLVASNTHDAWEALPRITAPTLVLHGDDDVLAPPANAPLLTERIPSARMHVFAGARHAYFDECRPESSELVNNFLG
ncbi:alpha/beta fold hydrolase [Amycolatopsis regifaucium]|uniref:Alpha/beta hydrolase n=1 Tax=Amycolatopsis regifaucium TaxID=546365 RepID=A0A154M597_9PSEU|nr:alpha/beta fold hydrolase [Amycolatopsis regifaucium]KZB79811.1 alpha/beta hydrolase [Amycolatopsis regifaucium]OKA09871.1 alpha/beta hydrolase [Amycolatopsis regifaucium]SFI71850.1 Pimeloyl-ACP methyl ester carboxylesterase [Amycolatopsis regifaucium]